MCSFHMSDLCVCMRDVISEFNCSVVCGTLVGVSVFSMMCPELLIMSEIS